MNTIGPLQQSIGISNNKTLLFLQMKQQRRGNRQSDFVLKTQGNNYNIQGNNYNIQGNNYNIQGNNYNYQAQVDVYKLPPLYIERQEEAKMKINEMKNLVTQVEKLTQQVELQGVTNKQASIRLEMMLEQAMDLLQQIDAILTQIENMPCEQVDDHQVQQNICKSLAIQLSEWTHKLSGYQQKHILILKQQKQNNSMKQSQSQIYQQNNYQSQQQQQLQQQQQMYQYELQGLDKELGEERDKEIKKIVQQMQRLNQLFKQMSRLVIEQGSLLDRIDVNLDKALTGVLQGKQQLIKAQKANQSPKAAKCLTCLVFTNLFLLFIFILKFTVFATHTTHPHP